MTAYPRPYSVRLAERPVGIGAALTATVGLGILLVGLAAMVHPPALSGWTLAGAILMLAGGGLIARVIQVARRREALDGAR